MNYDKNPNQARKLAKEQKRLRRIARQNPNKLQGRDRAVAEWDVEFDNYSEPIHVEKSDDREEYE